MKYPIQLIVFFLSVFIACTPSPQEIHFGEDACHACLMTIVDDRHVGQLVTRKGKAYKFDAIECMVREVQTSDEQEFAFLLVSDYDTGTLINAESATYLISPAIPSPMGAFLSAFESREKALAVQQSKGGQLYDWKQLPEAILQ